MKTHLQTFKRAVVIGASALVAALQTGSAGGHVQRSHEHSWPVMQEFRYSAGIRLDYRRADLDIPLYDDRGITQYRLICRSGDEERRREIEERTGASAYQNEMICILNVGDREADASLLSEDGTAARYSRGSFNSSSLVGACAAYPEYGLVRHFRLRGFELTIGLSEVVTTKGISRCGEENVRIEYALVTISLRRDRTARTAKAEQPGFLNPGGNPQACTTIRRGNAPRMCRDLQTFSWGECAPEWQYEPYPWERQTQHNSSDAQR
jgi:hypothetical protein